MGWDRRKRRHERAFISCTVDILYPGELKQVHSLHFHIRFLSYTYFYPLNSCSVPLETGLRTNDSLSLRPYQHFLLWFLFDNCLNTFMQQKFAWNTHIHTPNTHRYREIEPFFRCFQFATFSSPLTPVIMGFQENGLLSLVCLLKLFKGIWV